MLQRVLNAVNRMSDEEYANKRTEFMTFQKHYGAYMTGATATPPTLPEWA